MECRQPDLLSLESSLIGPFPLGELLAICRGVWFYSVIYVFVDKHTYKPAYTHIIHIYTE